MPVTVLDAREERLLVQLAIRISSHRQDVLVLTCFRVQLIVMAVTVIQWIGRTVFLLVHLEQVRLEDFHVLLLLILQSLCLLLGVCREQATLFALILLQVLMILLLWMVLR